MANLTIAIDEEILRKARTRATREGSSVNQLLREYLESYAGINSAQNAALKDLMELSKNATSRRGGKRWTREELHERRG
jgi:molybdenum-dependent DNA-binding transcriptional regulator ModE